MAQRFGGKYSPKGTPQTQSKAQGSYTAARVDPVGARANFMFLPPVALVFTALFQGAIGLVLGAAGAGVLCLGAWLLRGGLQAEAAYNDRKVARRPALPRKILAALLAGAGIGLGALSHDSGIIAAVLYGVVTAGLHLSAFGIDPLAHKGMEGVDTFQQDRVARVVDEADAHLTAMTDALRRVGDRAINDRMAGFQTAARKLIRIVEEDPRDLTAARKYLGVYLLGARDATAKFADIYTRNHSAEARADYLALLDDLERNFAARNEKLLLDDRSDLTIEIDVLRDRLDREGVRLD
ncbi:5-bromo-4-chloroindolyl phosphate hydrolysis family protein [Roseobacter weihaiensis]|uniref:5-bromo-4-chloroindolyl phosphate hydrolysis family protein n=1 Tax=Roseobacter weihaiensis TaxID=2763262 RepID=UPI001D0B3D9D|nr:5-bromo-4-chloroindolyl phosphate hydrolysis family protein [Roseobacter sp. H9]